MNIVSAAIIAYSVFDLLPKTTEKIPEPTISHASQGNGELLVQMASSLSIGSIPRGATRVHVGELNISASCDADISIDSITMKHEGMGSVSDISGLYFADSVRRVSRSARFTSGDGHATVRLYSLKIPKCSAQKLGVYMDFSTSATVASEHRVRIPGPSSIMSTAKSATLQYIDASATTFTTPYRAGKISVNFLPIRKPLRYGRVETVARLQLSSDKDGSHVLRKITLTNEEQAHDMDLINFRLENTRGELLSAPATRMHGNRVTIEFDPTYVLDRSMTVVLLVKAEVRASQRRGVQFVLEEPSDLVSFPGRQR